jgi:hypothetical protein
MSPTREALTDEQIANLLRSAETPYQGRAASWNLFALALRELQERRARVPAEACPTCDASMLAARTADESMRLVARTNGELRERAEAAEAKLRALVPAPDAQAGCVWTEDPDSDKWDTTCGEAWSFTTDGPVENGVKFCHGCGRTVMLAPPLACETGKETT